MLGLYYNLFTKFCDVNKFEELDADTDFLYVAVAGKELGDSIRPEMKTEWERLRPENCTDSFNADAMGNVFP